jgi:hypothetical protein
MPQKTHDNMKGTSPSPLVNRVVNQSWGQQGKSHTDAQGAIADQFNKHPVKPGDTKPTK